MPLQNRRGPGKSGYLSEDTIAAIASGLGGAIAILRISGPGTKQAIESLCALKADALNARTFHRVKPRDASGRILDDAMLVRFDAPKSYTGEDSAELHLHGSPLVSSRVLDALSKLGVRQALAGEFSFRAVRNGKMTISQAQAVSDLIGAANSNAADIALEKLEGSQARVIGELAQGLRRLATMGELGIDFSDQDVEELSVEALKKGSAPLASRLRELAATFDRGNRIQDGVSVAFLGLPNAGKSSFFNSLLGEDRSIVTEIEGTTRDVVRERLTLSSSGASITFRLHDTAGLRESSDRVEQIGISRSRQTARDADLVLWIVDASGDLDRARATLLEAAPGKKVLGVLTKWDLLSTLQQDEVRGSTASWPVAGWVFTSARTLEGISFAAEAMVKLAREWVDWNPGELIITRVDHLRAIQAAIEHVDRAASASELDLFAADIKQALHALSPIIGDTLPDDILGKIFSEFCIGK